MHLQPFYGSIQLPASRFPVAQSGRCRSSRRLIWALFLQQLFHFVRTPLGLGGQSLVGGVGVSALGVAETVKRPLSVGLSGGWVYRRASAALFPALCGNLAFLCSAVSVGERRRGVVNFGGSVFAKTVASERQPCELPISCVERRRFSRSGTLRCFGSSDSVLLRGAMSRLSEGDGWGGEGLHCFPENACGSLIFLHGLGDTASGWQLALRGMLAGLGLQSRVRLLLPTASRRPVTICGGKMHAWSDIFGLTKDAPEDKSGLLRSRDRVIALIEKEVAAGVSPRRIVVGGFSQGGAVAYLTALTMPFAVGGVLALSTWVPLGAELEINPAVCSSFPRVLHLHGSADEVVRAEYGRLSCESIRERLPQSQHYKVQFKEYRAMQHEASDEELKEAARFVKEVFTADEQ